MRKWYTYIIMLATVLFGSCNLEDTLFPEQECETDDITVRIILSMMDSRANTRAYDPPHSSNYETTALGNEYYINQYDVEVLVFDEDGYFVERATLVQATGPSTDYFHTYELTGTLSNVVENTSYQMVVLANRSGSAYCSNFPSSFTASSTMTSVLEGLVYTNYTDSFTEALLTSGSKERIPMWGVVKATLVNNANITVNMLRAMAKVRVNMDATTGYTLSSVTLKQANNGGYFTPTMTDGIKIDGSTASVSNPRIPISGLTTLTNLPFVSEPNSTSSYVIYVPEMATYSGTETARTATTWMEVAVNKNDKDVGLGENNKLYFREYRESDTSTDVVNGSFFNVVRNYFYDYTITGVQDNSGMELTLSVKDWTDVTETFNYESELSYNDGGWTNNFGREGNTIVLKSSSEANASTVTAEYNFQINTPQTIEWMAVLEDPSMKFEFDMDKTSGKGTAEGENAIQRTVKGELLVTGSNLTLGVKAVDPSEKGQYDAKLHVYVTYSGKTIELNLVDGQESTLQHFTIRHSKL